MQLGQAVGKQGNGNVCAANEDMADEAAVLVNLLNLNFNLVILSMAVKLSTSYLTLQGDTAGQRQRVITKSFAWLICGAGAWARDAGQQHSHQARFLRDQNTQA